MRPNNQQRSPFRRKKTNVLQESGSEVIDYKDIKLLSSLISDRGKIIPSRITGVSKKNQRAVSLAVKRARHLALLPYVVR